MKIKPVHPGEILQESYLRQMGYTVGFMSAQLQMPTETLKSFLDGKTDITDDLAARLGRMFLTTAEFWLNLQSHYDKQIN